MEYTSQNELLQNNCVHIRGFFQHNSVCATSHFIRPIAKIAMPAETPISQHDLKFESDSQKSKQRRNGRPQMTLRCITEVPSSFKEAD